MNIPIRHFYGFYISRDINDYNKLNALPPSFMSPDEAVNPVGKNNIASEYAGLTQEWGNCGVSDVITYLTDICKIFQWGWKFTLDVDDSGNTNVIVNVYKLIADDARNVDRNNGPITFNEFRQDWSDFLPVNRQDRGFRGSPEHRSVQDRGFLQESTGFEGIVHR